MTNIKHPASINIEISLDANSLTFWVITRMTMAYYLCCFVSQPRLCDEGSKVAPFIFVTESSSQPILVVKTTSNIGIWSLTIFQSVFHNKLERQ